MAQALNGLGHRVANDSFFDTIKIELDGISAAEVRANAESNKLNFRYFDDGCIGISLDETTTADELELIVKVLDSGSQSSSNKKFQLLMERSSGYLTHPNFNSYHSETEMMRLLHRLEMKDLSLNTSMIPLGSCTMKLNAASEMMPITLPKFTELHPYAPAEQAKGYQKLIGELNTYLAEITGLPAVSMQPNSGAQGEYTGLMVIRAYHQNNGEAHRNVCLIPCSAHGTNPASGIMAGMKVIVVDCDENGNIDVADLKEKAEQNEDGSKDSKGN